MRIVPTLSGWRWIRDGAAIFARAPVIWMLLVFSYWLLLSLIGAVPKIGALIGIVALPAFAASFMNVARLTAVGRQVTPVELFSGFRKNLAGMAMLGFAYFFAFACVIALSAFFDGGDLAQFILTGRKPENDTQAGALVAALAYLPVLLAYWFSPALVAWEHMSAPKAIFYSFYAALRNWRALLLYGVVLSAVIFGGTWLLFAVIQFLAPGILAGGGKSPSGVPSGFLMFVLMPIILAGLSILFASFYTCYRDILPEQTPP